MPKLSILGTGWGVRAQAPAFRAAGWTLHAIWGRTPERAEAAAREHGFAHSPRQWRDALAGADLALVATPPSEHAEQTAAALGLGVNVLCEKPLALDAAEARAMLEAERGSRAWARVDHELRFLPARLRLRDLVRDGYLGGLWTLEARHASDSRADPYRAHSWWSERERGGGVLGAIGSHVLDGLQHALERPVAVRAAAFATAHPERTDAFGTVRPVTADDYASLILDLGGAPGTVVLNAAARQALADLLILRGSEGTLVLRGNLRLEGARGNDRVLADLTPPLPESAPAALRADPWRLGTFLIARHLRDAVERGERPAGAATLEDGLRVQELLDEARRLGGWA